VKKASLALLLVGMYSQFGWQLASDDIERQAQWWNVGQSVQTLLLLIYAAVFSHSRAMWAVCGLLSLFSLMVIGCSGLWLIAPWTEVAGQGQCSTRFNVPVLVIQAIWGLILTIEIVRK